jgi:hypothetical protein
MEVGIQLGQTKMFLVCSPRVTRIQAKHWKFLKEVHSGQFLGGGYSRTQNYICIEKEVAESNVISFFYTPMSHSTVLKGCDKNSHRLPRSPTLQNLSEIINTSPCCYGHSSTWTCISNFRESSVMRNSSEDAMNFYQCPSQTSFEMLPGYRYFSGWKPTHLTSVFSVRTSVLLLPDGTMLTAFTDVARC